MIRPFEISKDYHKTLEYYTTRGTTLQAHISDIHFGVMDPKKEYDILHEQFIEKIKDLPLDCISIDGDLFDRLMMSNTDAVFYANLFVRELVDICKSNRERNINTVLVLLLGTRSHDADQLRLFYHYTQDISIDVRIVTKIQFEWINGCRVLCIPELYNISNKEYQKVLYESGQYDMIFMHGTIRGAVYDNKLNHYKIFDDSDFGYCMGPVMAGHVHVHQSLLGYCYYNGSPIRWCFGEEETKGFQIVAYDMDTRYSYVYLVPITSFRYDTVSIDDILGTDPSEIINYINKLKETGIDHIRLKCKLNTDTENNITILKEFYRNDKSIKFHTEKEQSQSKKISEMNNALYERYSYIFSKTMSPQEILAKYINDNEGDVVVTADQIIEALKEI